MTGRVDLPGVKTPLGPYQAIAKPEGGSHFEAPMRWILESVSSPRDGTEGGEAADPPGARREQTGRL